jgi:dihydrofolate reductase
VATFASVAASLDGFIRAADGDMSWLNDAMRRDEDYGMTEAMQRAGAYVLGATTYRESAAMFGGSTSGPPTYVLTHAAAEEAPPGVTFTSGDIGETLAKAQSATDRDVNVFGGGDVLTQAIAADALDELTIAVIPVVLGGGTRLFGPFEQHKRLSLTGCTPFPSGIVLLRYARTTAGPRSR